MPTAPPRTERLEVTIHCHYCHTLVKPFILCRVYHRPDELTELTIGAGMDFKVPEQFSLGSLGLECPKCQIVFQMDRDELEEIVNAD